MILDYTEFIVELGLAIFFTVIFLILVGTILYYFFGLIFDMIRFFIWKIKLKRGNNGKRD